MAVPVFAGDWVIGAIACSTFPRLLSHTFIQKMLPPLVETAARIAQACSVDISRHEYTRTLLSA
jgi:DNA-binding IclR family transcriptional regulator